MRWHEVPKFHYFIHIGLQASLGNPRFAWTYMDEDFMGFLKDIVENCTQGTSAVMVVPKLLSKWTFGGSLDMPA